MSAPDSLSLWYDGNKNTIETYIELKVHKKKKMKKIKSVTTYQLNKMNGKDVNGLNKLWCSIHRTKLLRQSKKTKDFNCSLKTFL